MNKTKRIATFLLALALVFMAGGELIFSAFALKASAEGTTYSGVMEDLQKDEKFNPEDYPAIADDYSLKVIQIAESSSDELYIYVYQPAGHSKFLLASSIVFSTGIEYEDRSYEDYELSLLSSQGVFQKYKVNGFSLKDSSTRYYAISEIFRPFDSNIDKPPEDDNTITHKAYPVGLLWTVTDTTEGVNYHVEYEDVIDDSKLYADFLRYSGGVFWFQDDVDSHYLAFTTSRSIDTVLEADIIFHTETVTTQPDPEYNNITTFTTRENEDIKRTLLASEILEDNTSGFFPESYKYNRIQSIESFLENEGSDLKESTIKALSEMKWVFRFYESRYLDTLTSSGDAAIPVYFGKTVSTTVTKIRLVRLMFEYDGEIYNLGVVADSISGDDQPGNKTYPEFDEKEWCSLRNCKA